jgi:hypothetical protein
MPVPLPVLPAVYYCALWGVYETRRTGITLAFKASVSATTAAVDAVRVQELADALTSSWNTTMGPLYPTGVTGWSSRVYGLEFPLNPAGLGSTTGGGANGGVVAPVSAAAIVRHTVFRRGRGSQSHSAISPLPAASVTDDGTSLRSGPILDITTEYEDFIGAVQAATAAAATPFSVTYVQLSKKGTGATYPIIATQCETLLGTERSRTPRP